jgi:hypothetical protein
MLCSACHQGSSNQDERSANPSSLEELLQAHDAEVANHGKDLRYIQPIGHFGRKGVLASLNHLDQKSEPISSYNGMELVFGVAEEARVSTGYDLCQDKTTLNRLSKMSTTADVPTYQRSIYEGLLRGYCAPPQREKVTAR